MSMTVSALVLILILPNLDRFDESDSDLMLSTPSSEYYSLGDINSLLVLQTSNDSLSLFHYNIRSPPKKFRALA